MQYNQLNVRHRVLNRTLFSLEILPAQTLLGYLSLLAVSEVNLADVGGRLLIQAVDELGELQAVSSQQVLPALQVLGHLRPPLQRSGPSRQLLLPLPVDPQLQHTTQWAGR